MLREGEVRGAAGASPSLDPKSTTHPVVACYPVTAGYPPLEKQSDSSASSLSPRLKGTSFQSCGSVGAGDSASVWP